VLARHRAGKNKKPRRSVRGGEEKTPAQRAGVEGRGSSNVVTLLLLFLGGLLSLFLFSHDAVSEIFRAVARTYFCFVKKFFRREKIGAR
jgi:hypothetical protein